MRGWQWRGCWGCIAVFDNGLPGLVYLGILCLGMLAVRAIHRGTQGAVERSGATGCVFILLMLGVLVILLASTGVLGTVLLALPALSWKATGNSFAPMSLDSPAGCIAPILGVMVVAVVLVKCSE